MSREGEDSPFPTPTSPRASLHSERSGSPDAWRLSAPSTDPPPLWGVGSGFLLLVLEASPSITRAHGCRLASLGQPRKALTQPPQFTRREAFWGSLWVSHVDGGLAGLPGPPRASASVPGVTPYLCWGCLCSVWALEVGAAGPRGLRCHPRCGGVPTVWVWPGGGLSYAFLPAVMFTGSVRAHGALHDGHQRPGWLVEREPCLVPTRCPPGQSSGSDIAP